MHNIQSVIINKINDKHPDEENLMNAQKICLGNERSAATLVKGYAWYEREKRLKLFEEHAKV